MNLQSSYQMLFGVVLPLQGLKVFGSVVYPYVKPYNDNKLQPRVVLCIFLGYANGYKSVIYYHPHTRKFIISRHVIYNEDLFPCKSSSGISKDQFLEKLQKSQGISYTHEATNNH